MMFPAASTGVKGWLLGRRGDLSRSYLKGCRPSPPLDFQNRQE